MVLTGKEVEMMFRSFHAPSQTQNVIGYIPGTDKRLKDAPIIIGAHLDHLGCPGILFPGALDNASGSAIVMETAKAFAQSGVKPLRPVVFILFGAEEPGMLGSKFYVKHPLFPLEKTLCMFNLDMVGNGTELRVGGVNTFPELKNILRKQMNSISAGFYILRITAKLRAGCIRTVRFSILTVYRLFRWVPGIRWEERIIMYPRMCLKR